MTERAISEIVLYPSSLGFVAATPIAQVNNSIIALQLQNKKHLVGASDVDVDYPYKLVFLTK